jgi:hypothetical protein
MLPIGAYPPRWFMRTMHMDPEALQAAQDVGAGSWCNALGHLQLSREPAFEPIERTRAAWISSGRGRAVGPSSAGEPPTTSAGHGSRLTSDRIGRTQLAASTLRSDSALAPPRG